MEKVKNADIFQTVTDKIIDLLNQGVVPWHRPWSVTPPSNPITGTVYRGVNSIILGLSKYDSPHWLTRKQVKRLGGFVRTKERPSYAVHYTWQEKRSIDTGDDEGHPILCRIELFNLDQCYLPRSRRPRLQIRRRVFQGIRACERVVAEMKHRPKIQHGQRKAWYRPGEDLVGMPDAERFERTERYYCVLFHELVHSTGHESRLNRKGVSDPIEFGSPTYSKEELIAEMGAAFLCAELEIDTHTIEPSAGYIEGWLNKLGSSKRLVIDAGIAAQNAANLILNRPRQRRRNECK